MKIRTNVRAGVYYDRCGGTRCGGSTRCGGRCGGTRCGGGGGGGGGGYYNYDLV